MKDYSRGHAHALVYRRHLVPEWAVNDTLLRELIVFAFERRVGLLTPQLEGPLTTRHGFEVV